MQEFDNNNKTLIMTSEKRLEAVSQYMQSLLEEGATILNFFDTETTGTEIEGDKNDEFRRDRLIEIGIVSYLKNSDGSVEPLVFDGSPVTFHEYINPFAESDSELMLYESKMDIQDAVFVHGMTKDFLFGKVPMINGNEIPKSKYFVTQTAWKAYEFYQKNKKLPDFFSGNVWDDQILKLFRKMNGEDTFTGGIKLPKPAPTFDQVRPFMDKYCNAENLINLKGEVVFVAHNSAFDVRVMNAEYGKCDRFHSGKGYHSDFESYFKTLDTLALSKELIAKSELDEKSQTLDAKSALKSGYNLDYLQFYYGVTAKRDVHGALVDSFILAEVYKKIIEDERYISAPNKVLASQLVKTERSNFEKSDKKLLKSGIKPIKMI